MKTTFNNVAAGQIYTISETLRGQLLGGLVPNDYENKKYMLLVLNNQSDEDVSYISVIQFDTGTCEIETLDIVLTICTVLLNSSSYFGVIPEKDLAAIKMKIINKISN